MVKVALLIGVSEYQPGLEPLPSAVQDMAAVREVLENEAMGGFDDVVPLPNPTRQDMEREIYNLFDNCQREDVVLLYFSGHGVKDRTLELFLTTPQTEKTDRGIVPPTAVAASYLQQQMQACRSERTVVILDCCYSGAFAKGMTAKDDSKVDVLAQLGGKGRAILTSSTAVQSSFQHDERPLSIYTHYLVEGIKTGAADLDGDGQISADELHQYTHQKVTEESPAMTPEFYPVKEGHHIFIAKSSQDDPLLRYRREVRRLVEEDDGAIDFLTGEFDEFDREVLNALSQQLRIDPEAARQIEREVIEPLWQYHQKLQRYGEMYAQAIKYSFPISQRLCTRLADLRRLWGLRDEDVAAIEAQVQAQFPKTLKPSRDNPPVVDHDQPKSQEDTSASAQNQGRYGGPIIPKQYERLAELLQAGDWRGADAETAKQMLAVMNRTEEGYLDVQHIENFPCEDLRAIDQLWVHYSQGRFGFSVQKRIYQSLGGKRGHNQEVWNSFGEAVGWRVNGSWLYYKDIGYDFSINSPDGHLPGGVWLWERLYIDVFPFWIRELRVFFLLAESCRL